MEFLPGAFEQEWERRRAILLYEHQIGKAEQIDWDVPRRGGVARMPGEGAATGRGGRRNQGRGGDARPMRTRFQALARGSQPAVVKLASYGGGGRAGSMIDYVSRSGDLTVENEAGARISGKDALAEMREDWEHLFDNRADSRDVAVFNVTVEGVSDVEDDRQDELVREILRSGFGDRRFVYAIRDNGSGEREVSGVVVLRDGDGERLTGDNKAASVVQQRFDESDIGNDREARFRFHGYGNGVEFGTARVRNLVERFVGDVRDETGREIADAEAAGDLVQKEWRKELHSRKGRDVMHLVLSARAGTNADAFNNAVRDFLADRFEGHRYVFALHDPSADPKEMGEGGRRPHVHAHAIVTMRSEAGERIVTSPQVFRQWRAVMAEKAREHGIEMEMTDRRELASAPAYSRNQVRPVSYHGRTEHEGTSEAAQARYDAKRSNRRVLSASVRSRAYSAEARETWQELARDESGDAVAAYAAQHLSRIRVASRNLETSEESQPKATDFRSNMVMKIALTGIEEGHMREMTRPEFEDYEKRVEGVLARIGSSIDEADRKDFEEVAAAAREVVDIRREYLQFTERQAGVDEAPHDRQVLRDGGEREGTATAEVEEIEGQQGVRATHEGENRVESVREISPELAALHQRYFNENLDYAAHDRTGAQKLMDNVIESYPKDQLRDDTDFEDVADHYVREHFPHETPARQNEIAARIGEANEIRQGYYSTWRELEAEAAAGDPDVLGWQAEQAFERQQLEERDAAYDTAYNEGFEGRPIPDIAKGDPELLANYEQGLRALETEIAVTDAENGIGSAGWGRADGSWTKQDSEAAWENFHRRSGELREFQAEQVQAAYGREGLANAAEWSNDDRVHERGPHDDPGAPPARDEIARDRDRDSSDPESQHVQRAAVQGDPERIADDGRSDPPQQHVPRLQELERELEERRERDRDDRER